MLDVQRRMTELTDTRKEMRKLRERLNGYRESSEKSERELSEVLMGMYTTPEMPLEAIRIVGDVVNEYLDTAKVLRLEELSIRVTGAITHHFVEKRESEDDELHEIGLIGATSAEESE